MREFHVNLLAGDDSRGEPVFEPVHVVRVGESAYRVLYTPGLVYNVAADDEIELLTEGKFCVLRRGQNLAVRVFCKHPFEGQEESLLAEVNRLGGRLDGRVKRGLAFTIPVVASFRAVENVLDQFISQCPTCEWEYGNVYDENDQPLGWWPAGV